MTRQIHLRVLPATASRGARALFRVARPVLAETGLRPGDTVAVFGPEEYEDAARPHEAGKEDEGGQPAGIKSTDTASVIAGDTAPDCGTTNNKTEDAATASPSDQKPPRPRRRALGRIVAGPVPPGAIELDARALGITGAGPDQLVALGTCPASGTPIRSSGHGRRANWRSHGSCRASV